MTKQSIVFWVAIGPIVPLAGALFHLKYRKIRAKGAPPAAAIMRSLNPFSSIDDSVPLKEDMWLIKVILGVVIVWGLVIAALMKYFD